MFDIEFDTEIFKLFIIELTTIVCNDGSREVESVDYRFPYKFSDLSFNDLGHWFGLCPFSEVVDGDNEEFSLVDC